MQNKSKIAASMRWKVDQLVKQRVTSINSELSDFLYSPKLPTLIEMNLKFGHESRRDYVRLKHHQSTLHVVFF